MVGGSGGGRAAAAAGGRRRPVGPDVAGVACQGPTTTLSQTWRPSRGAGGGGGTPRPGPARRPWRGGDRRRPARAAARCFRRALEADSRDAAAALNLIEALAALGKNELAADGARRALALLDRGGGLGPAAADGGRFPPEFDVFRVEWERAAWSHAGDPASEGLAKQALLRWRLQALLGDLTGDPAHFREAVQARPDLPTTQAALGCARASPAGTPRRSRRCGGPWGPIPSTCGPPAPSATPSAARATRRRGRTSSGNAASCHGQPRDSSRPRTGSPRKNRVSRRCGPSPPEEFRRRFGDPDTSRAVASPSRRRPTHTSC